MGEKTKLLAVYARNHQSHILNLEGVNCKEFCSKGTAVNYKSIPNKTYERSQLHSQYVSDMVPL